MTAARDLADAYFDYRQSTDLFRLFSFGQVDNLDQWEDVSSASLGERQGRLREFAAEAPPKRRRCSRARWSWPIASCWTRSCSPLAPARFS